MHIFKIIHCLRSLSQKCQKYFSTVLIWQWQNHFQSGPPIVTVIGHNLWPIFVQCRCPHPPTTFSPYDFHVLNSNFNVVTCSFFLWMGVIKNQNKDGRQTSWHLNKKKKMPSEFGLSEYAGKNMQQQVQVQRKKNETARKWCKHGIKRKIKIALPSPIRNTLLNQVCRNRTSLAVLRSK